MSSICGFFSGLLRDPLRPGRVRQQEVRGVSLLPEDLHGAHAEGGKR